MPVRIYLAGPIAARKGNLAGAIAWRRAATKKLLGLGVEALLPWTFAVDGSSPHRLRRSPRPFDNGCWKTALRWDLMCVHEADAVVAEFVSGTVSEGTSGEVTAAHVLWKPVVGYAPGELAAGDLLRWPVAICNGHIYRTLDGAVRMAVALAAARGRVRAARRAETEAQP